MKYSSFANCCSVPGIPSEDGCLAVAPGVRQRATEIERRAWGGGSGGRGREKIMISTEGKMASSSPRTWDSIREFFGRRKKKGKRKFKLQKVQKGSKCFKTKYFIRTEIICKYYCRSRFAVVLFRSFSFFLHFTGVCLR